MPNPQALRLKVFAALRAGGSSEVDKGDSSWDRCAGNEPDNSQSR